MMSNSFCPHSRITIVDMAGAAIHIEDALPSATVLEVKQCLFLVNRKLHVRRQRLVYTAGPLGMEPLANEMTLGDAGVAQDGSAELDVLLADLTEAEAKAIGPEVWRCFVDSAHFFFCFDWVLLCLILLNWDS